MNEIAVMRGNYPVLTGMRIGDAIYYTTSFSGKSFSATPRRGLDFAILAYSIVNGLRRSICGYNINQPPAWGKEKCDCIRRIYNTVSRKWGVQVNSLKELLLVTLEKLIDLGLVKPIPDTGLVPDIISPQRYLYNRNNYIISNDLDLASLSVAMILQDFFTHSCRNIPSWSIHEIRKAEEYLLDKLKLNEFKNTFYYKTLHGEMLRSIANAASLPSHLANFEARVLPFLAEPPPPTVDPGNSLKIPINNLKDTIIEFFVKSGISRDIATNVAKAVISGFKRAGYDYLNNYQYNYLVQLLSKEPNNALALLTSPTGSGKTLVFTVYSILLVILGKLSNKKMRVVITYPRKALARDQLERMIHVIYTVNDELAKLNINNSEELRIIISIRDGNSMDKAKTNELVSLRGIGLSISPNGRKEMLCHGFVNDKYVVVLAKDSCKAGIPNGPILDWIMDIKEEVRLDDHDRKVRPFNYLIFPDILITNNSMLSKLSFDINRGDLWIKWLKHLKLLVIDEAHVFTDPKELEKMFLTITRLLWLIGKRLNNINSIDELMRKIGLNIIISSATLTESSLFRFENSTTKSSQRISSSNIIGLIRSPQCHSKRMNLPGEVEEFIIKLLGKKVYQTLKNNIIYRDYYYDTLCARGLGHEIRGHIKLNIYAVTFPTPQRSSWTSLSESTIALLHWINMLRNKLRLKGATALIFIDNKLSQKHIMKLFAWRQILDAADHADRVLMSVLQPNSKLSNKVRKGYKIIMNELNSRKNQTFFEAAWDLNGVSLQLSHFHALGIYQDSQMIGDMLSIKLPAHDSYLRSVFQSKFNYISSFIDNATKFAELALMENVTRPDRIIERAKQQNLPIVFIMHNADIKNRHVVEDSIKSGEPYLVMTTSTLEVGIDIPSVVLVAQYASTPTTAELVQRFGRSGRGFDSLLISTGLLILRNTGEDVHYLSDNNAVDYVFNLKFPPLPDVTKDPESLARSIISFYVKYSDTLDPESISNILNEYLEFIGVDNNVVSEALNIARDSISELAKIKDKIASYNRDCGMDEFLRDIDKNKNQILLLIDYLKRTRKAGEPFLDRVKDLIEFKFNDYGKIANDIDYKIYLAEEMRRVEEDLRDYIINTNTRFNDSNNPIVEILNNLLKIRHLIETMIIICVKDAIKKGGVRSSTKGEGVINSFIYRFIRPGLINELGELSEKYVILFLTLNHPHSSNDKYSDSFENFIKKITVGKYIGEG